MFASNAIYRHIGHQTHTSLLTGPTLHFVCVCACVCVAIRVQRSCFKPRKKKYKAKLQLQQVPGRPLRFLRQVSLRLADVKQQKQTAPFALPLQPCQHVCVFLFYFWHPPVCFLNEHMSCWTGDGHPERKQRCPWPKAASTRTPTRVMTRQALLTRRYL